MNTKFKNFDASTVDLAGSNLIEASAGTGKTYSIAILVLRLLLEKQINIREILMVTFTKAAVAELEERIRLFVRTAQKAAQGESVKDGNITQIVENARNAGNPVNQLLEEAVAFLDETAVLTIHSFCQQTLNEFAFETQQLFNVELMQDEAQLIADECNKFWRKYVSTIPTPALGLFHKAKLSKSQIQSVVKSHSSGTKYYHYQPDKDYTTNADDYAQIADEAAKLHEAIVTFEQKIFDEVKLRRGEIEEACAGQKHLTNWFIPYQDEDTFLKALAFNRTKTTLNKMPCAAHFLELIDELELLKAEKEAFIRKHINILICNGINQISESVTFYKSRYSQVSFDDLIAKLHVALVQKDNDSLVARLQEKYKAVFIDEFQDTDRLQYEIFDKAFGKNTILFYIGDPKQSIYAWRKADVQTYFRAKNAVDNLYGMNQNYRSSARMIAAMNIFFKPKPDTDTFNFGDAPAEKRIDYIAVEAPENTQKGNLLANGEPIAPIQISVSKNKGIIQQSLVAQIAKILDNDTFQLETNGIKRKVLPKDIGILVRKNSEGIAIKNVLSAYGIQAVTINDGKVLQTQEAQYLLYLLQAIIDINRANINKALLSPFTAFKVEEILALNSDLIIELFKNYKSLWEKDGIYTALKTWIKDFAIEEKLLKNAELNGERTVTNLNQLIELLHKTQNRKNLNSLELISWLKRGIEGMETEGDEFEQRIESDEDAIKIVTIHKSKGLEYNIVFIPSLDFLREPPKDFNYNFRDESGNYISGAKHDLSADEQEETLKQVEQENRRLIYVAITRAVSQCYIYKSTASYYKGSSMEFFIKELDGIQTNLIQFVDEQQVPEGYRYRATALKPGEKPLRPIKFTLLDSNWHKLSYSALRADHPISTKNKSNTEKSEYDDFIFNQLRRGAKTGNMLHFIFENIHFNNPQKWADVIEEAIKRFVPQQQEYYAPMLNTLLENVLNAPILLGDRAFKLSDVNTFKCIHEFEFDFLLDEFLPAQLSQLSTDAAQIAIRPWTRAKGLMNGKIDLFFEHDGKYYVLDWKSNYLGDRLEDYDTEQLSEAMNENNYHLQYLIYSLAVRKYLESRIPNFNFDRQFGGVIYLFVRGMRSASNTGVFTAKPSWTLINKLDKLLNSVAV
ncbi:exodeoxyribonuclease V subunit beta [Pelobium manganitolerans]|nr:exodeoxyribonuclease V subunit beta [Pelobium manganitolerans]